jgi:hypothetical protein
LGAAAVVLVGLAVRGGYLAKRQPKAKKKRRLPRWDKRRQSSTTANWVSRPIDDRDPFG